MRFVSFENNLSFRINNYQNRLKRFKLIILAHLTKTKILSVVDRSRIYYIELLWKNMELEPGSQRNSSAAH